MDEIIAQLKEGQAVLVIRVDHHDDDLRDVRDEQKWMRRLIVTTLLAVVMTLATTIIGIAVGG